MYMNQLLTTDSPVAKAQAGRVCGWLNSDSIGEGTKHKQDCDKEPKTAASYDVSALVCTHQGFSSSSSPSHPSIFQTRCRQSCQTVAAPPAGKRTLSIGKAAEHNHGTVLQRNKLKQSFFIWQQEGCRYLLDGFSGWGWWTAPWWHTFSRLEAGAKYSSVAKRTWRNRCHRSLTEIQQLR